MAIGRPIELTPNIATKNISSIATADQTQFTVTGGYRINEIAVYRNGVRLADGRDFTASDGDTVNLVTGATVDDVIEFSVFDSFNIAGTIVSAASSQNLNGDLNVTGNLYAGDFNPSQLVAGIVTASTSFHVGSALTANAAGDVQSIGIITAASFSGDGSALTGLANTDFVVSVATTTGNLNVSAAATITGATTLTGAVNVDATTDSTSTSTGALIVDGGVGIAKNVYIGAGLSVAGTLTYEDVTNVDAVGMVTAKSGVNVSGGELNVGLGFSVGHAGIITSTGGIIDLKNSGSVSNIKFYCESANAHYTALQSAAHSAYGGNVTLTLPATTDTLIGKTTTDTLTNKTLTSPTITGTGSLTGGSGDFSSNLTVGSGITFGSAGVSTFSGTADVHLTDGVRLNIGDGSDHALYHDGTQTSFEGTVPLYIKGSNVIIYKGGTTDKMLQCTGDGASSLWYSASKKIETTNDGVSITGICSATDFSGLSAGAADFPNGINVANTKTVAFPGDGATGATIKHQSGHFEINNDTGNVYFDTAGNHYLRTNGSTTALTLDTSQNATFAGTVTDSKGDLRDIPLRSVTGSQATLVAADAGKVVSTNTTGWVVPASTFAEGDTVSLLNNSGGGLTITCSAVTTYLTSDGSTVTSSTLGARGMATLYFVSASVAYLQGTSLS